MLRRAASILAVVFAPVGFSTRAAASPSARLVYVRDATASVCPDEASLRQAVKQRVGYDPFFPWAKTTVVVDVTGEGRTFVAHVRLVDESGLSQGARELRPGAKGCSGLIDAAALAISIALDMDVPHRDAPGAASPGCAPDLDHECASVPAPAPEPAPVPVPAPAPMPASAHSTDERDATPSSAAAAGELRGLVGFDALAAVDAAPALVAPGFDVWAAARRGVGSLGLEMRADAPSAAASPGGGSASVLLVAATVAPCVHLGPAFACALGAVDWIRAAGSDVRVPRSGSAFAPAVGPRVGLELALSRSIALRVRGDLMVNLVLPTASLNGVGVWRLPQAGGILGAGLAYRFP
jgi:hypothetical protein